MVTTTTDWKIIPKEEEQDFCRIGDIYEEIKLVPKLVPFPPLMGVLLKKQNKWKLYKQKNQTNLQILICWELTLLSVVMCYVFIFQ
jgi:hypothetical protein